MSTGIKRRYFITLLGDQPDVPRHRWRQFVSGCHGLLTKWSVRRAALPRNQAVRESF